MKIKYISLALAILSLLTAQTSQALPVIDGIVEAGEYTNTSSQSYKLDNDASDNGSVDLYWEVDAALGDLFVGFVLDNRLVDNCYGISTSVGADQCGYTNTSPSGGYRHPFSDLRDSDKAEITIGTGSSTLDFKMDYLKEDGSSWTAPEEGGSSFLDESESSMTYNIKENTGKWSDTTSPILDGNWDGTKGPGGYDILNPLDINVWDFLVTYEFKILAADLVGIDTSFIDIYKIHISDSKLGGDHGHILEPCTVDDDCPPVSVPEPSTLLIMALGLLGLGITTRRRRIL
jgi:hypothetical protein